MQALRQSKLHAFCFAQHPKPDRGRLTVEVPRSHTHPTTPLSGLSFRYRVLFLHNTQQMKDTKIPTVSGIQTCSPSNYATADPRLRLQGHRDRRKPS
jgi:hypothetical protein